MKTLSIFFHLFLFCLFIFGKIFAENIPITTQADGRLSSPSLLGWPMPGAGLPPGDVPGPERDHDADPSPHRLVRINVNDPANLTLNTISLTQIDLAWTLNATNDPVMIVTSPTTTFGTPTDGIAYAAGNSLPGGGTVVYVGGLSTFSHTGLSPGTGYCYKIWSVDGGNLYSTGLSPVCGSTQWHTWTGNVNTDWFNAGNWGPGSVPTASNGAYLPAGRPNYPSINAAGAICNHLFIETGASLSMSAATGYTLQVKGDWTNNGTFTQGIGTVQFNGSNDLQTIKGSSTTAFHVLHVDKGAQNRILEVTSLISLHAATNPLNLQSGTFKLSSASTITPFTNNIGASLSSIKGLWINGGTINLGNFNWLLDASLLRISAGSCNVGTAAGNSIIYLNNGTLIMEGGTLTIAGLFRPNSGSSTGTYTQTGGVLTVATLGSTNTSRAAFELNAGVTFTMSGGTIVVARSTSNASGDLRISSTTHNLTGGTIQLGDASTPISQTIRVNCTTPLYNLEVSATNSPVAQLLTNSLTLKNNLTLSGGTLNANNLDVTVGGHWTNHGTFTPGTGTVTFNGEGNQNLGGSTATVFHHLTVNKANAPTDILNLTSDMTVNGTLTVTDGRISTGSNDLTLGSSATVAGEANANYVIGTLQTTRTVNNNTVSFGDMGVVINGTGENLGTVTVTRQTGALPLGSSYLPSGGGETSINRIWTIVPTTQPSSNVAVTLTWLSDNDNGITDFSAAQIWKSNDGGATWQPVGATQNGSGRSVSALFSSFSSITVSGIGGSFPVEWLSFEATPAANAVILDWATASEQNNAAFTAERSTDGIDFEAIGAIAAAGNSAVPTAYTYTDAALPANAQTLHYRLRQTDMDGKSSHGEIRTVSLDRTNGLMAWPNPTTGVAQVSGLSAQVAEIQVFTAAGQRVSTVPTGGQTALGIDLSALPAGVYTLRAGTATLRVVKQ